MKKILIVIDYQTDFVTGALGFPQAETLEEPIAGRMKAFRDSGGEIAFTYDTHNENYLETLEGRFLPVTHCVAGTEGWAHHGQVAALRRPDDMCFYKPTFGSGELYEYLKRGGYDYVELVGLVSNICVLANAVMARTALPNARVCVDAALTASYDPALHQAALDVMGGLHIEVINRA